MPAGAVASTFRGLPTLPRTLTLRIAAAVCLALGLGCGGLVRGVAAETLLAPQVGQWRLPPLEGEFTGEFRPLTIPDAPILNWKLILRALPTGIRAVDLTLDGPGTRFHAELRLDAAGNGTWKMGEAEVDLTVWSASAAGLLGEEFAAATAEGLLRFEGEGTIRNGALAGRARLVLRDGRMEDPVRKLLLTGLALDLTIEEIAERRSTPRQLLTWSSGHYDAMVFGRGYFDFTVSGDRIRVDESSLEIFGGEVVLAAFAFSAVQREATVLARVLGIDVSNLLPLLPEVLSSARGRVDGSVTLHRTKAGVQIGGGSLSLRAGETADLRLAPTPGLLSSSLPETVLKYYPGLGKIETGEMPLRAERLEVAFTPGGDAQGRTAVVRIVGGPVDPSLRAPIDLNVNVRGPLESLIKFGTDSRLRFGEP